MGNRVMKKNKQKNTVERQGQKIKAEANKAEENHRHNEFFRWTLISIITPKVNHLFSEVHIWATNERINNITHTAYTQNENRKRIKLPYTFNRTLKRTHKRNFAPISPKNIHDYQFYSKSEYFGVTVMGLLCSW